MTKRSLETKIILSLGLVLTTLLGIYAVFDIAYENEVTYKMAYRQLEALTNTIQKSLIKDMRSGRGSDVQEILEIVGTEPGIVGVSIFDEDGRILKSGKRAEVGQAVPDNVFERYRGGERDFITEESGNNVIHIIHPIANAPQCNGCHGKTKEIIGVLMLDYSLEGVSDYINSHTRRLVAALAVTIILVGLLIFLLLKRMVSDPIVGLQAAMAKAEQGNLDISIDVGSGDEIGSLQESFNRMLYRIKELNEKNMAQQKAIMENEQDLRIAEHLSEKNKALQAANAEVLEKNHYYMEMLSFISHELKNPLVVLKGYTTLLAGGDLDELTASQFEAVQAMDRNVDTLNDMIANYMNLSMLERGELAPQKKRFSVVEDVIKPLMYEYAEVLEKASMSLRIDCPEDNTDISADQALMKSIVGNLVSNAVKYGRTGTDIIVEVGFLGDEMRLSVFNEGQGIPAKDLEKVFDRFRRLDNDVTMSQKGTGLGLYLVKTIVGLHGGSVAAESREGEWAKIICTFPVDGQEA